MSSENSPYTAALVLKSRPAAEAPETWEAIALFARIGPAADYAEMCDTYAAGHRYLAAEVPCAPEELIPAEGGLPLFQRVFRLEGLKVSRRPRPNASTAEAVEPAKHLHPDAAPTK